MGDRQTERAKGAYLAAWLRRHREATIQAKDANVRIDTQRRQQDAVRVLAEAACELRRRLDLEEQRTRGDLIPCRAEPGLDVRAETCESTETSGEGLSEVYVYALKVSVGMGIMIWGWATHRHLQLFALLVCFVIYSWQKPVPIPFY